MSFFPPKVSPFTQWSCHAHCPSPQHLYLYSFLELLYMQIYIHSCSLKKINNSDHYRTNDLLICCTLDESPVDRKAKLKDEEELRGLLSLTHTYGHFWVFASNACVWTVKRTGAQRGQVIPTQVGPRPGGPTHDFPATKLKCQPMQK